MKTFYSWEKYNNYIQIYDVQKHSLYIMQDKDKRNSIYFGIMKANWAFFYSSGKPPFNSHRWCHIFHLLQDFCQDIYGKNRCLQLLNTGSCSTLKINKLWRASGNPRSISWTRPKVSRSERWTPIKTMPLVL